MSKTGTIGSDAQRHYAERQYARTKRVVDVVVAAALALITLPLQLVLLLASAISFRANPIFEQDRLGVGAQPFAFRKIRSLPATAPTEADKYELKKVKNSRVGQFLRISHLDELLQFWSVLGGSMSIVGPRPEMLGLSDSYPEEFVRARTSVRPGITGLWQVSHGSKGLIGETPEYDLAYLDLMSLKLDTWIAYQTVRKILTRKTVGLDETPGFDVLPELQDHTLEPVVDLTPRTPQVSVGDYPVKVSA